MFDKKAEARRDDVTATMGFVEKLLAHLVRAQIVTRVNPLIEPSSI